MRILITCLLLFCSSAHAAVITIDFEEFNGAVPQFGSVNETGPIVSQGFELNANAGAYWVYDRPLAESLSIGLVPEGWFSLSATSGQTFNLESFTYSTAEPILNIAIVNAQGRGDVFSLTGLSTGSSQYTYEFAGIFDDIQSVTFFASGGAPLFNDIVVAAVPVPAAAWLFGSALAAIGWMRRRPGSFFE